MTGWIQLVAGGLVAGGLGMAVAAGPTASQGGKRPDNRVVRAVEPSCTELSGYLGSLHRANADYLLYLLAERHPWREQIDVARLDRQGNLTPERLDAVRRADAAIQAKTGREFMLDAFRNRGAPRLRDWDGEYAGKWLDAASLTVAAVDHPTLVQELERFAADLRQCQEPDGYFGLERPSRRGSAWDMWNHWYLLAGLTTHYETQGDARSLEAAERLGRHILTRYGPPEPRQSITAGAWSGGCTVDVLDQLVRLWRHAGDDRYLELGERISAGYAPIRAMRATGELHYTHAYVLTAYLGGMVLYNQARHRADDNAWIEAVWRQIAAEQMYPSGSIGLGETLRKPEAGKPALFDRDGMHSQETCATVEWLLLTHRLYEATGKVEYAHQIENIVYNALPAARSDDGMAWAYYLPLSDAGGKTWWQGPTMCCYWSGPRGIARLPRLAYHTDAEGVRVDLLEAASVTVPLPDAAVRLEVASQYPAEGRLTVSVHPETPVRFALKMRVPPWAANVAVSVEGLPVAAEPGRYAVIERRWSGGERVTVAFDMAVYVKRMPGGETALFRGPELLSLDQRDNEELDLQAVSLGRIDAVEPLPPLEGRRRYRATMLLGGRPTRVVLTPYAAAGNDGAGFRSTFTRNSQGGRTADQRELPLEGEAGMK